MYEEVLFIEGPRLVQHIPILNKQAKNKEFLMQLDVSEDRRFCILNKFISKHFYISPQCVLIRTDYARAILLDIYSDPL